MTATQELPAADPAAGETAAIALPAPDDEDPRKAAEAEAAEAARCRESAQLARDLAARVLAEGRQAAEAEAARIITEAAEEAARLTAQADESDADGAWHELQARLLPEAAAARREISGIRERRAALAARVPEVQAEQADAEQRLAGLAGRRADQEQWRQVARRSADVDALKGAAAEESAISEAEAAQRERATAAGRELASLAAEAEAAGQREAEAAARLADLERQLDGYLPVAERDALADKVTSAAWEHRGGGNRDAAGAVLAWCSPAAQHAVLSQVSYAAGRACCARLLDELCQGDPDAFAVLLDRVRDGSLFAAAASLRPARR